MEEVAAARRARSRFGDLAFSSLAAGLGLVLLFATGWHLFGASSGDQPDRTLASISATAVMPAPRRATVAGAQAVGSRVLRVPNVAPAKPTRARSVSLPRGFLRPGAPPATSLKPAAPPRTSILPATPRQATINAAASLPASQSLARASRPLRTVGVKNTVSSKAQPRANVIARTSPAAAASRPRAFPARVARLVTSRPHPAPAPTPAAIGARRPSLLSAPHQMSARGARVAEGARTLHRSSAARAPSIIEPPLGYDARPALVLVSGAEKLELGETAMPTIRSKRRH